MFFPKQNKLGLKIVNPSIYQEAAKNWRRPFYHGAIQVPKKGLILTSSYRNRRCTCSDGSGGGPSASSGACRDTISYIFQLFHFYHVPHDRSTKPAGFCRARKDVLRCGISS